MAEKTRQRTELNKHSRLLLNARLAERDTWDESAVDEHGTWLTERLVEIWPGPDVSSWTYRDVIAPMTSPLHRPVDIATTLWPTRRRFTRAGRLRVVAG